MLDARTILARLDAADRDVLGGRERVAHEVLEDHADVRAQLAEIVFAQVMAIEQDAAFVRVVEAREQFHQRRLAGAVLADQCQHFAGVERERKLAHGPMLGAGITEADVLENESLADRPRKRARVLGGERISGSISKNE